MDRPSRSLRRRAPPAPALGFRSRRDRTLPRAGIRSGCSRTLSATRRSPARESGNRAAAARRAPHVPAPWRGPVPQLWQSRLRATHLPTGPPVDGAQAGRGTAPDRRRRRYRQDHRGGNDRPRNARPGRTQTLRRALPAALGGTVAVRTRRSLPHQGGRGHRRQRSATGTGVAGDRKHLHRFSLHRRQPGLHQERQPSRRLRLALPGTGHHCRRSPHLRRHRGWPAPAPRPAAIAGGRCPSPHALPYRHAAFG